jgi:hypothetical protein
MSSYLLLTLFSDLDQLSISDLKQSLSMEMISTRRCPDNDPFDHTQASNSGNKNTSSQTESRSSIKMDIDCLKQRWHQWDTRKFQRRHWLALSSFSSAELIEQLTISTVDIHHSPTLDSNTQLTRSVLPAGRCSNRSLSVPSLTELE